MPDKNPIDTSVGAAAAKREPFSGKIFCLMGKSASGKDTLYGKVFEALDRDGANIKPLLTYTTRPQRLHEKNGDGYFFISLESLTSFDAEGVVIEQRDYETEYGKWSYATIDDGQLHGDNDYLIIGTPEMEKSFEHYFSPEQVVPMLVFVDDGVRLARALSREMEQGNPKYDEMCRRYLSDKHDFEEIDADETVARFENNDFDKCAREIVTFIRENTRR